MSEIPDDSGDAPDAIPSDAPEEVASEIPQELPAELPRFAVSEYKPDGGFAVSGFWMLLSAMAIAGAILGFAAHLISQWIWLILVFPAAIGFVLGLVGQKMATSGRIRSPLIGGLAGLCGGVLAMTAMHYFDYEQFKSEVMSMVPDEARELAHASPREQAEFLTGVDSEDREIIELMLKAGAVDNFLDYMDMEADFGVQLKGTHGSGDGMNLGYYGSYIYWLVEIAIVAWITFAMVKGATLKPFCVDCGEWKTPGPLGFFSTNVPETAAAAVKSGDLNAFRAAAPTPGVTNFKLIANTCLTCRGQGDVDIELQKREVDKQGKESHTTMAHTRYPAEAIPVMEQLFK